MKIFKLELTNFRSYRAAAVLLKPGYNSIVGENNVGKSNLVAAIPKVLVGSGLEHED